MPYTKRSAALPTQQQADYDVDRDLEANSWVPENSCLSPKQLSKDIKKTADALVEEGVEQLENKLLGKENSCLSPEQLSKVIKKTTDALVEEGVEQLENKKNEVKKEVQKRVDDCVVA